MRHTSVVRVLHTALYPLLYDTKTATNFRHICTSSRSVWTLFSFVSIFKRNVQHVSVIEFEVNFDIEHQIQLTALIQHYFNFNMFPSLIEHIKFK